MKKDSYKEFFLYWLFKIFVIAGMIGSIYILINFLHKIRYLFDEYTTFSSICVISFIFFNYVYFDHLSSIFTFGYKIKKYEEDEYFLVFEKKLGLFGIPYWTECFTYKNIKTIEEVQSLISSKYDDQNERKKYYYSFKSKKLKTQIYYINNKNKDSIIKNRNKN